MHRQSNKVKNGAVVSLARDFSKASNWMRCRFRRSQMEEEHPSGPLEMAVEASNGSSMANPITFETIVYGTPASQADELSLEVPMPAEEFSSVTEAQVKAIIDEGLIDQPTPRRTDPTTVILPKFNMEHAIKYQGTVLYEKQRGQWVAEPMPEKTAEKVSQTVPTYHNNGVLDFKRIAYA